MILYIICGFINLLLFQTRYILYLSEWLKEYCHREIQDLWIVSEQRPEDFSEEHRRLNADLARASSLSHARLYFW